MVIYFNVDENGHLTGWSSTQSTDDDIRIRVEDNHEVLNNPFIFKHIDGELIKDEDKQQQLINEQEAEENKASTDDMNTMAIFELAMEIEALKK